MSSTQFQKDSAEIHECFTKLRLDFDVLEIRKNRRGSAVIAAAHGEKFIIKLASKGVDGNEKNIIPSRSAGIENEIAILRAIKNRGPFSDIYIGTITESWSLCAIRYIEGISGFQIPPNQRIPAIANLLSAVCTLHDLGYVHGDIQSKNLIFQIPLERTTLIDFEFASRLDSEVPQYPATKECLSPESARDVLRSGYVERKLPQDIYALSMACLSLLEGKNARTFRGVNPSLDERMRQIASGETSIEIGTEADHTEARLAHSLKNILLRPENDRPRTVRDLMSVLKFG